MKAYESGVRVAWRGVMHAVESSISRASDLGRPIPSKIGQEAAPVLLVHGYGNSANSMSAIDRSLQRDGFRTLALNLPNHGFGDADLDAQFVSRAATDLRNATGSQAVSVVGHSRGGLVSRLADQTLDSSHAIGRVVTVSSANQGIHMGPADAVVGALLPDGMQQIRRGSSLIDRLRRTAGKADVIAVGTRGFDRVLAPAHAAQIDGAPFITVDAGRTIGPLSRVGHYNILHDHTAYEAIRGALLATMPR